MTKKMRSYRIDESTDIEIKELAKAFGKSEAETIEMAISWMQCSGFAKGVFRKKEKDGYFSTYRTMSAISKETKEKIREEIMNA